MVEALPWKAAPRSLGELLNFLFRISRGVFSVGGDTAMNRLV